MESRKPSNQDDQESAGNQPEPFLVIGRFRLELRHLLAAIFFVYALAMFARLIHLAIHGL